MIKNNPVKIYFKFFDEEVNEYIIEGVWAVKQDLYYKIDNIPFYAYLYSTDDIVEVIKEDDILKVNKLIEPSGNSTIRIIFEDLSELDRIREELNFLNCDSEINRTSFLLALNIPRKVSYREIKNYLDCLENSGVLQYEESCISEHHKKHL